MDPRGLDPEMIVNLHDILEKKFSEIFAWLDASLANQDKDRMRKEFHRCLWSWSILIQKGVV